MLTNAIIRKATEADCPQILQLVHELAVYEKAPNEVTVTLAHFVQSGFGNSPVWQAFVAVSDSKIIGFALYYTRYSTWKGQRMYLEDLLVTEPLRGNGIGKLLFEALITECKQNNYSGLVWQVLSWNEPAINFYKKYQNVNFDNRWLNCSIEM